ncbi:MULTISPECIES: HDIG domain-containing metalloprotein [unclassified Clostridium]|uniref:HDIG domain-containing metalloprotein n=1 Tax=unclassified Clostridium TaxID=2614128 RepID=UPI0025C365ED|nr:MULTISPECIES: HDIG domain-containing metalloprotein [unclassified Clostridium]
MERKEALALLKEHVKTDRVLRHSLAVEGAMIAYAIKFGQDEDYWGLLGLLHDIDFEKYPEEHPNRAPEILEAAGFDETFIASVLSHSSETKIPRDSKERQCLHAVDEMASFIIAIALMRPTKLEGLNAKSVKKKMKDKAFAKAVNREQLITSAEELGVEFNDHVDTIVNGLIAHEAKLQEEGYSLLD